jgi:Integrase zinc binding domain
MLATLPSPERVHSLYRPPSLEIFVKLEHTQYRHAKWFIMLQEFTFTIIHKSRTSNKSADVLNRRDNLMPAMKNVVLGFEKLPRELQEYAKFRLIIEGVEAKTRCDYLLHDGYLFFGNLFCIPNTSLRFSIVQELHKQGHFGATKTIHLIRERFFWPNMSKDIKLFVKRCQVCQAAKRTDTNQGLYTSLHISTAP